jgi:hypothetical protein
MAPPLITSRRALLLAAAALLATGVDALAHFSPASSRVRSTASSSYRLHRVAPSTADERSSLSRGAFESGTRLCAVAAEIEAPHTLRSTLFGKARRLAGLFGQELLSPKRMVTTVFVSVLIVAARHLSAIGNPLQLALVTACLILETLHLATSHDGFPPA